MVSGVHYFFITPEKHADMVVKNEFVEWAEVRGNKYGTSVMVLRNPIKTCASHSAVRLYNNVSTVGLLP